MKKRRILTTLSIVMKTGKISKRPIKILYVEFEKLRETCKQHIHELNSLQTKKSSLLLLETQLQLERVTDEKLTHMLSIQKSLTDKTGLGYVAPPADIPSTSRTVFVKPTVPEPPLTIMNKGKYVIGGHIPITQKPPPLDDLLYAITAA
jgi:hypothetical protein